MREKEGGIAKCAMDIRLCGLVIGIILAQFVGAINEQREGEDDRDKGQLVVRGVTVRSS